MIVSPRRTLFSKSSTNPICAIFPSAPPPSATIAITIKLTDYSLAAIAQRHQTDQDFLERLQAIPTTGFSDQDQLSHDLMVRVLQQRIADFDLKEYEMPINQQNGIHTSLADLPLSGPVRLRQALRGLHCASAPDSAGPQSDHGGPARRHERQADAGAIPAGENSGSVSGHH